MKGRRLGAGRALVMPTCALQASDLTSECGITGTVVCSSYNWPTAIRNEMFWCLHTILVIAQ